MKISFASINDTEQIMNFLGKYWKQGHILSLNQKLFLYEFQEQTRLNFAIAKDEHGAIWGLFGFIKYNSLDIPDLAGSLWKVREDCQVPLLGLKLRDFVIKNIAHRFFAAPGAGIQTKPIYQVLKMQWYEMDHYFVPNDTLSQYQILVLQQYKKKFITKTSHQNIHIEKIESINELENFNFKKYYDIAPFKDLEYIKKRFINYPFYSYDIYKVMSKEEIINIFICRAVQYQSSKAYRIVDFYGDESFMYKITTFLYNMILTYEYEYFDFVCSGFNVNNMLDAGFQRLDFQSGDIIPNFFEPFIQKNIAIYGVSDLIKDSNLSFRQCKADGDQDRPNCNRIEYES